MTDNFELTPPPEYMTESLSHRQLKFCQEYVFGKNAGNASQCALEAGYKKESHASIASENLQKPTIRQRIGQLEDMRFEITKEDFHKTVYDMITVKQDCLKKNLLGKMDVNGVVKAVDTLCKMLGWYAPTKEIVDSTQTVELSSNVKDTMAELVKRRNRVKG